MMNKPIRKLPINEKFYNYNEIEDWIKETHGFNPRDYNGRFSTSPPKDVEYLDFWHYASDHFVSFQDNLMHIYTDDFKDERRPEYVRKILKIIIDEFYDEDIDEDNCLIMWIGD